MSVSRPSTELASLDGFDLFVAGDGERLRRALVAHFGVEVGNEVTEDALLFAWQHWHQVASMPNRVGYLFRVGQSASRRYWRWRRHPRLPVEVVASPADPEPGLHVGLALLPARQRGAVVLVHGYSWSYEETAEVLGVPVSTIRNDVHRGLQRLRLSLGVHDDR